MEVAGKTMLDHVLAAARAASCVARVFVVSNIIADDLKGRLPEGIEHVEGADGPAQSVLRGVEAAGAEYPFLVLTADNPMWSRISSRLGG